DDPDRAATHIVADEYRSVVHGALAQGVIALNDLLGEHQQHGEHMGGDGFCVASALVDDQHARVCAVLHIHRVKTCAVGGNHQQIRHACKQAALDVKPQRQHVAG